jgi:hypothetical protein
LLGKNTDESRAQTTKLVLLDQLIKIDTEQFKDQTEMLPVDESILQTKQVVVVVLVIFAVKLHGRRLEYFEQTKRLEPTKSKTETSIIL